MSKLKALLDKYLRYWMIHAAIALAITFVAYFIPHAWALAGAVFYLGREIRDREKLGTWDWPGLLAPVIACTLVWFCT